MNLFKNTLNFDDDDDRKNEQKGDNLTINVNHKDRSLT